MSADIRVLRGNPAPEELAALIMAMTTPTTGKPAARRAPRDRTRWLRPQLGQRGPGAWRRGL